MSKSRFPCVFLILVICTLSVSCGRNKYPPGFPKIYPIRLQIVQEGTPLDAASVALIAEDPSLKKWPSGGRTDAQGMVNIQTHGFDGAPIGNYKVTVVKVVREGGFKTVEEADEAFLKGIEDPGVDYSYVEECCNSAETTPLTLEVKKKNGDDAVVLDAGQAVKEALN